MESVRDLSNEELNKKLAITVGLAKKGKVLDFYQKPIYAFCSNWDLLMPYVVNHGIDFFQSTTLNIRTGNMYASDVHREFEVMKCEDPQRALAECLLLVLQKQTIEV